MVRRERRYLNNYFKGRVSEGSPLNVSEYEPTTPLGPDGWREGTRSGGGVTCSWIVFQSLALTLGLWEPEGSETGDEQFHSFFPSIFGRVVSIHINEESGHCQRHLYWPAGLPAKRQRN